MTFKQRYGPWAVIAGASEGTGREFARQVAAEGVSCILLARRPEPLDRLADEIRAEFGVGCVTGSVDLAAVDVAERIGEIVGDRDVGLYISNAGGDPNGKGFLDAPLDAWVDLVQRNVTTVLKCTYRFAASMKARGSGGIILVNSGACYGGLPGMGPYCGSKAFNLCLAEALWAELKRFGVDVLTLVMSKTDTPEFRRFMAAKGREIPTDSAAAEDVARLGLERLAHGPITNWGEADDEAGMTSQSAAQRRERIMAIQKVTQQMMGKP